MGKERRIWPLAPAWSKIVGLAYQHGEAFYGFQGLRAWKSKFAPVWEARYLACPGGLWIPGTVANVTSLVSGGVKGLFTP